MNAASLHCSPFGAVALLWTGTPTQPLVRRILLPQGGLAAMTLARQVDPAASAVSCAIIDGLLRRIEALLGGKDVRFSLALLDLGSCPPFQQAVLRATAGIPRGRVRTYEWLAVHLGKPGASRAVGNALANNPFPLVIPCHRVIRSGGQLGGFGGGSALKRALLAMEGVEVAPSGHVLCPRSCCAD